MSDDMNDDMSDDKKTELNDENSHDVHKIYSILKQQMSAPQLTEKDLKNATTDRNSKAIFISNSVKEAYEKLPEEDKQRLKWYGEDYYNRVIDTVTKNSLEQTAHKLKLIIKSGLSLKDLNGDELAVLRSVYGNEWYLDCGYTKEEFEKELV